MKNKLLLDAVREVGHTKSRFLSILVLSALAVAFLAGLRATQPDMEQTVDTYFDRQQLMDVRVLSTLGLTEDDVLALGAQSGVARAEGGWSADAVILAGGQERVVKLHSLSKTGINAPELLEGRLPQRADECVTEARFLAETGLAIGDAVTMDTGTGSFEEALVGETFTIVGIVNSPLYLFNAQRGTSSLGTGMVSAFFLLREEAFAMDYTDAYLLLEGAEGLVCYSTAYDDLAAGAIDALKPLGKIRAPLRQGEIIGTATGKLDDAQKEFDDAEEKATSTLADASAELDTARAELADGWRKWESGVATLQRESDDGRQELLDAQEKLTQAQETLDDSEVKYQDGAVKLEDGKTKMDTARAELATGLAALEDGRAEYAAGLATLTEKRQALADGQAAYLEGVAEYTVGSKQYEDGVLKYEDGLKEYADGKLKLDAAAEELEAGGKKLEKAKRQLESGSAEHEAGLAQYESKKAEFDAGYAQFDGGLTALRAQLSPLVPGLTDNGALLAALANPEIAKIVDATAPGTSALLLATAAEFDAGRLQLDQGKQELDDGAAALAAGTAAYRDGKATLKAGRAEHATGLKTWEASAVTLEEAKQELEDARVELGRGALKLAEAKSILDDGTRQLADGEAELVAAKGKLDDGEREYADGKKKFDDGAADWSLAETELADARVALDDGRRVYEDGKTQYEDGTITLARETKNAQRKLEDAEAELQKGEKDYAQGVKDYETGKLEAEIELADARKKLGDARRKIGEIEDCKWYFLGRETNAGFVSYQNDAERMGSLASVFPLIFFLVAALVCLTTMTRMVEEQRVQIGGMKALGYTRGQIAFKYVGYGFAASLLGGGAGLAVGLTLIPGIIYNAWKSMYTLPELELAFLPGIALLSLGAAVVTVTGAALWAGIAALSAVPAELMRPKAPAAGKRVFLERVAPIWRRLSFSLKVALRNLFRYKKRFWMTVIGIGGCTALIVVGFGLRDSILSVVDKQYLELNHYQSQISLTDDTTREERDAVERVLAGEGQVEGFLPCYQTAITVETKAGTVDGTLIAPEEPARLAEFITLRERGTHQTVPLGERGVVLTEKMAAVLQVAVGDRVTLDDGDRRVEAEVSGITENYVSHFVYLPLETYRGLYGEEQVTNLYLCRYGAEVTEDAVAARMMRCSGVTAVSSSATIQATFASGIQSVDYAVVVIIIAAAALAFVVLYNLTNINITERLRELATLKVLGFYDGELSAYVYRENIFLTAFGIVAGLGMGFLLHRYVVLTVEIDMLMFVRSALPRSYGFAVVLTALFSLLVNIAAHRRLKKIDMVESLKTVE